MDLAVFGRREKAVYVRVRVCYVCVGGVFYVSLLFILVLIERGTHSHSRIARWSFYKMFAAPLKRFRSGQRLPAAC